MNGHVWRRARCASTVLSATALLVVSGAASAQGRAAVPAGLGLGGSVGVSAMGGSANAPISSGVGFEGFVSGGVWSGLFGRLGVQYSGHDVSSMTPHYQYLSVFLEPRYVALGMFSGWAPFIAARAGRTWEKVLGRTYTLKATGHALAGGGGVMVRLAPQIAVEGGVLIGASRFDDYRFIGEFAWKDCLDQLDRGTPLPESISRCAGSRSTGRTVLLCYPPYFTEGTSDCDPPEIPYAGTSRNGTWVRAWIGVTLSLSTALSD